MTLLKKGITEFKKADNTQIGSTILVEISASGDTSVTVIRNAAEGPENEIDTVRHNQNP